MKVRVLEIESELVREMKEGEIEGDFSGRWRIMDRIYEMSETFKGFVKDLSGD